MSSAVVFCSAHTVSSTATMVSAIVFDTKYIVITVVLPAAVFCSTYIIPTVLPAAVFRSTYIITAAIIIFFYNNSFGSDFYFICINLKSSSPISRHISTSFLMDTIEYVPPEVFAWTNPQRERKCACSMKKTPVLFRRGVFENLYFLKDEAVYFH
jgi:hypothetical protein